MDRSAAGALFAMSCVLLVVAGVAWSIESPLDEYRTLIMGPGEEPTFGPTGVPDREAMLTGSLVEALRRAPLVVAAVALAFGLLAWFRSAPDLSCPLPARIYFTLAPLLASSAIAAAWFTPPDVVSLLLLTGAQWVLYVPIAMLLLTLISTMRGSRSGREPAGR